MINSVSSQLITSITINRNRYGEESNWSKSLFKFSARPSRKDLIKAEAGYALTVITALVETAVSGVFCVLALPLALVSREPLKKSVEWLQSSSFSILWSVAYLVANYIFPHLLTREDYSRNHIFRADYQNFESWKSAPLASSLFMMVREMPEFLATAYALRFPDVQEEAGRFDRLRGKFRRYKVLISGLLRTRRSQRIFRLNAERLTEDFDRMNTAMATTTRAICAYFVSGKDTNGAILGNHLVYYHHYKIAKFQKHFDVSAKVVQNTAEMFAHLRWLKETYPTRPIKVVDMVSHGYSNVIAITCEGGEENEYSKEVVEDDQFAPCAPDAAIIIDACSTGAGPESIARKIAQKNPGKRVFAPASLLYFSRPSFRKRDGATTVDHVTHGFAIVNAHTSRQFHFPRA